MRSKRVAGADSLAKKISNLAFSFIFLFCRYDNVIAIGVYGNGEIQGGSLAASEKKLFIYTLFSLIFASVKFRDNLRGN